MLTRREFSKATLAALPTFPAFGRVPSKIHGVQIGVAGFSYNDLPREGLLDVIIRSMTDSRIRDCLLFAPSTEPPDLADRARPARGGSGARGVSGGRATGVGFRGGRAPASPEQVAALEQLRQWHLTVGLDHYVAIRKRFNAAGLEISAFDASPGSATSDEELDRACQVTKILGARCMMVNTTKSIARRIAPIAGKHELRVAFQGRPDMNSTDSEAIAKPSDFDEVMAYSKYFGSSVDVGATTAGGWDVMKFIQDTHPRVFGLNLKDRRGSVSMPWGEGDTRIDRILRMIRDRKYPIPCYIDCEFATPPGSTRQNDVKRCLDYAKSALA